MIYTITGYEPHFEHWILQPEEGCAIRVDLVVSAELEKEMEAALGDLNNGTVDLDKYHEWCRSLIGKKVEVRSLTPWISIGNGITLFNDQLEEVAHES